jgi:hypothetical protein
MRQDMVEFARLLSEIRAVGLADGQAEALGLRLQDPAGSEGRFRGSVGELFDRADIVWERAKRQIADKQERVAAMAELRRRFDKFAVGATDDQIVGLFREGIFRVVGLPRFQKIEDAEVLGLGKNSDDGGAYGPVAYSTQGSEVTERSERARSVVERAALREFPGIVVEACERLHVAEVDRPRPRVWRLERRGLLVTAAWRGLRVSREFTVGEAE